MQSAKPQARLIEMSFNDLKFSLKIAVVKTHSLRKATTMLSLIYGGMARTAMRGDQMNLPQFDNQQTPLWPYMSTCSSKEQTNILLLLPYSTKPKFTQELVRWVDTRSSVAHFSITVGWVAEQAALRASTSHTWCGRKKLLGS